MRHPRSRFLGCGHRGESAKQHFLAKAASERRRRAVSAEREARAARRVDRATPGLRIEQQGNRAWRTCCPRNTRRGGEARPTLHSWRLSSRRGEAGGGEPRHTLHSSCALTRPAPAQRTYDDGTLSLRPGSPTPHAPVSSGAGATYDVGTLPLRPGSPTPHAPVSSGAGSTYDDGTLPLRPGAPACAMSHQPLPLSGWSSGETTRHTSFGLFHRLATGDDRDVTHRPGVGKTAARAGARPTVRSSSASPCWSESCQPGSVASNLCLARYLAAASSPSRSPTLSRFFFVDKEDTCKLRPRRASEERSY